MRDSHVNLLYGSFGNMKPSQPEKRRNIFWNGYENKIVKRFLFLMIRFRCLIILDSKNKTHRFSLFSLMAIGCILVNKLFIICPICTKYLLASLQYNFQALENVRMHGLKFGGQHILTSSYIFINACFWGVFCT